MVLVDNYRLLCDVDTLLGTDGIAQLAADAAFPHYITLSIMPYLIFT